MPLSSPTASESKASNGTLPMPCPWVSWRTYRTPNQPSKTLLLNQLDNEFLLLEDAASEYWAVLCTKPASWSDMASQLNLSLDALTDFAGELAEAGLVRLPPPQTEHSQQALSTQTSPLDVETSVNLERETITWAEQHGFVYAAHWELTYRCNELCVHCYNPGAAHTTGEKPRRETDELTTQEAKQLLHGLVDLGVFRLTLSGGEATLRKDFVELLAYARQLGFQVVIYTNGLTTQPEMLEQIASLYPSSVEISIYSADPDQHDAVTRVPGSFEKSIQSLAYYRQHHIHTAFKASLTKNTIGNWQNTLTLGQNSADTVILNAMISQGVDGKEAPLNTAAEFGQLVVLAATPGSPIEVGSKSQNWGCTDIPTSNQKPCGAGHGTIAITPAGDIYPCISFPMSIGNFRKGGLQHLKRLPPSIAEVRRPHFSSDNFVELLDQWRSVRMEDLRDCGQHECCHYCGDVCPGDAFVQTSDPLRAATNHCRQAEARMTAGKLIQAGHSLEDLRQLFGVSAEFGRECANARPSFQPHPFR